MNQTVKETTLQSLIYETHFPVVLILTRLRANHEKQTDAEKTRVPSSIRLGGQKGLSTELKHLASRRCTSLSRSLPSQALGD